MIWAFLTGSVVGGALVCVWFVLCPSARSIEAGDWVQFGCGPLRFRYRVTEFTVTRTMDAPGSATIELASAERFFTNAIFTKNRTA